MNVDFIWDNFLNNIKSEVNSLTYETWFNNIELYEYENGLVKILVPMTIYKKHLSTKYYDLIKSIIDNLTNSDVKIEFYTKEELNELIEKNEKEPIDDNYHSNINVSIDDLLDNKEKFESNLNKKYTFDNFIVGNTNKFAQNAALKIAENPGVLYNPLFIYGNSGLGKTHLMHAIGNYIVEHSNKRVLYVSSQQFISDFIEVSRKNEQGSNINNFDYFKNKYRNIDVLIVDDIQFFQTAPKTQNEFFSIFNRLFEENKQIVISSDRSPDDLKELEKRLITRLAWGLSVDIYPPDLELRIAIIKKRIMGESINQNIPDEVIEYIAANVGSDVRHLEGSINRLLAYSAMMNISNIDLDVAMIALKDFINKGYSEKNSINRIQKIVAEHFQVSVDDLKSKKRSANLTFPRQVAMYLCRTLTDESFPKIGIDFGGKDHSTVMHSVEKIETEIKINKELYNLIEKLKQEIT